MIANNGEPDTTTVTDAAPPKPALPLRTNMMWTGIGNSVYLACQYAILMVLAKLGNPALVGQFSLGLAIAAPVVVFSQMQMRQMQVTDVKKEYLFADYFCSRILMSSIALAVIAGIALASRYSAHMSLVVLLIGTAKVFESLSDIAYGKMQRHERMDMIAASMVAKGIGSITLFGAVLWTTRSLVWATAGMGAVWTALFFLYDLPRADRMTQPREPILAWRFDMIRRLVILALPLALAAGLGSLLSNMSRYYLQALRDASAVGKFAVALAPLALITLLCGAITQASTPRAATYYQRGQIAAFKRLILGIAVLQVGAGVVFTLLFALFGRSLISMLFTPEYRECAPALVVMSAGLALGGLAAFGNILLVAGRLFNAQLGLVVVVTLVQIPVGYCFIAAGGVMGAAWAEFAKYIIGMLSINVYAFIVFMKRQRELAQEPAPESVQ